MLDRFEARAIVLLAPAGYGKTVLAVEWLQGRRGAASYRANESSADLVTFVLGIAASLERVVPGTKKEVEAKFAAGLSAEGRALAEALGRHVQDWPRDGILLLDDYHYTHSSAAVQEFVDVLLGTTPIRLFVTTRSRPPWATARRILYGEVVELGRDQLAMTQAEASQVLRGYSPATVRTALTHAQGWPAVIGLLAVSAANHVPQDVSRNALYRYFAEEVLKRQAPAAQELMLAAAIPRTLEPPLLRDLGFVEAEERVAALVDDGLVERVDDCVRFHPLLREFLREKLRSDDPRRAAEIAQRAVAFARRTDRVEDAFELSIESGRRREAAAIAAEGAPELLVSGKTETLERWLRACGAEAIGNPTLELTRAGLLLRRGELRDAAVAAAQVVDALPEGDALASRANYVTAQAFHLLNEREEALAHARRAVAGATSDEEAMNALLLATLAAAALELDSREFIDRLEELAARHAEACFRLASATVWAALSEPSLDGAWERVEGLVAVADECAGPMLRSDVLGAAAHLRTLRGEYNAAFELASRATAVAADFGLRVPHAFCLLYLAGAQIGQNDHAGAERTLKAVETSGYMERVDLKTMVGIARMKLAVARRRTGSANGDRPSNRASRRSRGAYLAISALLAAHRGDRTRAHRLIEIARTASKGAETSFYARHAAVVADGPDDEFGGLVEETAEAGMLDSFVLAYRARPELLEAALRDERSAEIAATAVRRAHDRAFASEIASAEPADAPPSTLTARERDVLELLRSGLSNAEIAQRLFISENTVKVHVHNILAKSGAKSRLDAVARTRD